MRRYLPTLLVVFGLLAVGALAIVFWQSGGGAANPATTTLLYIVAGVLAALVVVALIGYLFGLAINGLAQLLSDEKPVKTKPPAVAAPATAPAVKKPAAAPVPLTDNRSALTFWLVVAAVLVVFLTLRALAAGSPPGFPLDRVPSLTKTLFDLPGLPVSQAIALGAVVAFALVATIVVGIVLAKLLAFFGRLVLKAESARPPEAGKARAAGPAARPAAGEAPKVPLNTTRSALIFFAVVGVILAVFLELRSLAAGTALGFTPFDRILKATLFTLPGDPYAGWPAAIIPGPGNPVLAWQAAVLATLAGIGGVAVVGFGLARLITLFSATQTRLEKAPPAWPAQELQALEQRWQSGAWRPFPRRLNGLDQVILVLFVVIAGLVLVWVVPGIGLVSTADQAVAATQIAASWTPTPQPGPVVTLAELVAQLPKGDAAAGEAAVKTRGCVACHIAPDASVTLVGPAWLAAQAKDGKGIADHAAARWQDAAYTGKAKSAAEYLYESIVNPTAYVVAGYQPAMPANFGTLLSDQEKADIVAYLETLK